MSVRLLGGWVPPTQLAPVAQAFVEAPVQQKVAPCAEITIAAELAAAMRAALRIRRAVDFRVGFGAALDFRTRAGVGIASAGANRFRTGVDRFCSLCISDPPAPHNASTYTIPL